MATKCWYFNLAVLYSTVTFSIALDYTWLQFNDYYDCVVGIAVDDKPISTGVFVTHRIVLTAANPLEAYTRQPDKIKLYYIHKTYDKSKAIRIDKIIGNQQDRMTSRVRVNVGFDNVHSTIHDLMRITIRYVHRVSPYFNQFSPRQVFYAMVFDDTAQPILPLEDRGWSYVGFGFVDAVHVKENMHLEAAEYLEEPILVDCDEWIPREWGRFICVANVEKFLCISSGAGLFYRDVLYGIGAFELTKGDESILVFTDIRQYPSGTLEAMYTKTDWDYENTNG